MGSNSFYGGKPITDAIPANPGHTIRGPNPLTMRLRFFPLGHMTCSIST